MSLPSGLIRNKECGRNLRRKVHLSDKITVSAGANSNLLLPIMAAPISSRVAVESVSIINESAISAADSANNSTIGALKIGHSTAAGTFDDDSIFAAAALPYNSSAKVVTNLTHSNFASTLKTGSKYPENIGLPIVPANGVIWSTATEMAANGTGSFRLAIRYWELDDEKK